MGVHPFRDPAIADDQVARTVRQAPDYPMQMMVAVFDFPAKAGSAPADQVPLLAVDRVRGIPGA